MPKFDPANPVYGQCSNPQWAGVRSYLAVGAVWRETITGGTGTTFGDVGTIQSPNGPAPGASGDRNWLYVGSAMEMRGSAVTVRREWRLSGPKGWSQALYSNGTI